LFHERLTEIVSTIIIPTNDELRLQLKRYLL